ncbi:MAG TPA: universal stress protein [Candidatus Xenobia bacterium]
MPARRILVPTDLSNESLSALAVAREVAAASRAKVILMYVDDHLPSNASTFAATAGEFDEAVRMHRAAALETARDWMRVHAPDPPGERRSRLVVRYGDPVRQMLRYVRQHDIDLVVVATYGRSRLAERLLGSVATALSQQSPCPVLIVPRAAIR